MLVAPRLSIAPYSFAAAAALEDELGVSHTVAQVLVRRGLADPEQARAWLAADERHPLSAFGGIDEARALVLRHVEAGSRITVHGDYDVDGVCATAVLVRALRRLGADVDWYLPSRTEDGYGLARATVERLAARGTQLLVTVDCAITAVDEVAAARAAGLDVLVTDHHSPRADRVLPDAPILHPRIGGYPCADLCAAAVAHRLAEALGTPAADDLDLVALATVADCVPLVGENRRLVREGLRALAQTAKPGLRALMRHARVDPSGLDARAIGFRLAPRINAAGRLRRADAGLELVLTDDEARADEIAAELGRANAERRDVETRILFEAEAQVAAIGEAPAYVLAGEGWHPGVIGIVASRIVERHHRPAVLIALDGDTGTGSGRAIPAYDLLAGLVSAGDELERYGGHRAAAGLTIARERVDTFRAALTAHAAATLAPADLVPEERVDAIAGAGTATLATAEELERLAPFGIGNPEVNLLLPAAVLSDPRPMGEGKHLRLTVESGGARARAVAFGVGGRLPVPEDAPVDAIVRLERNVWNGAVEPRLLLRCAHASTPLEIEIVGEPRAYLDTVFEAVHAALHDAPPPTGPPRREPAPGRRMDGIAATIADLVGTGEPVLAVCADVPRRIAGLRERVGGFALCSWAALEHRPELAEDAVHLVAIDPPAHRHLEELLRYGRQGSFAHRAWGPAELRFAEQIHEHEYDLRAPLTTLYRDLRAQGGAAGEELEAMLRGTGRQARSAALAGRLIRVLAELGLVSLDRDRRAVSVPPAQRTELERSEAYRAYSARLQDGRRFLSHDRAARAA